MIEKNSIYLVPIDSMVTLTVNKRTRKRLAKFGIKNSTWDSILNELMNHAEQSDRYWECRFQ